MVGKGRREMGEGGIERLWSFIPQPHPRRKKVGEKEGGERRRSGEGGCCIWNLEAKLQG